VARSEEMLLLMLLLLLLCLLPSLTPHMQQQLQIQSAAQTQHPVFLACSVFGPCCVVLLLPLLLLPLVAMHVNA